MTEPVKFVDLDRMHGPIRKEIDAAIAGVIDASDFVLGEETRKFEDEFARYCGAKFCIGVNSGTDALRLALKAMGVGPGDEVIVPANSFIATALTVSDNDATPVFADVDETSNMDPASVERRITKKTKALVPVHLFGQVADMGALTELARKHSLLLMEDCAQAHGAAFQGKRTPVSGLGCFSFYPSKNLGALGDGGAIVTNDAELAGKLRDLRNYGSPKKYFHPIRGYNSRLDSLQAAVLRVKLRHLDAWTDSRRKSAARYHELLGSVSGLRLPVERQDSVHAQHIFAVRTPKRDALREHLAGLGIITNIHFPTVIYDQAAYAESKALYPCPVAETHARELLSLPMFPFMTEGEITRVCDGIKSFFSAAPVR